MRRSLNFDIMASKIPLIRNRYSKADKSLKVKRAPARDMGTDSKETQQFLMDERNIAMESSKEAENELHNSKTEMHNLQSMLNFKNHQCRQLLENLKDKDLYVQMLQDELVREGAEITAASIALSEIRNRVKCIMQSTILAHSLDEEEVRKLCKANRIEKDTKHDGIVTTEESSDGYPSSQSTVDDGTASIVNQIDSVNVMISKFAVISSVVQDKLKSQLKQLESDKKDLEKQFETNNRI